MHSDSPNPGKSKLLRTTGAVFCLILLVGISVGQAAHIHLDGSIAANDCAVCHAAHHKALSTTSVAIQISETRTYIAILQDGPVVTRSGLAASIRPPPVS